MLFCGRQQDAGRSDVLRGSVPEDAEAQCALAWQKLQAQLRAAGMEIENLVKISTIVRSPADVASVRAGRASVLGTRGRRAR